MKLKDRSRSFLYQRRLYYSLQALFFIGAIVPGLLISQPVCAQQHYDFNVNCLAAYHEITELRLAEGQRMLDAEKRRDPSNLIPVFLENYIDFFHLFFSEDPAEYERLKSMPDKRIGLMSNGPESSPYNLFTRAVIHFQWAAIRIKFGSNWDAGWEFRRSFLQCKEVEKKWPQFKPAIMLSGTMQVVAGTIPDGYKWLSGLLGIKGNIGTGMSKLNGFLGSEDPIAVMFRNEAIFYYLYLKFYIENKHEEVFTFIHQNKLDIKNNHLFTYLAANLGINDQQAAFAEQVMRQRNDGEAYYDMPFWDMEMGYARLYHLEADAGTYLERFLQRFKGRFYVKDVLLKLSWHYYLQGDNVRAAACRDLVLKKGAADSDADKQALKDAKNGKWPDKILLKARLLSDGGYYNEALQSLAGRRETDYEKPEERCEFTYRLGRIYDGLGRKDEAIFAYQATLRNGANLREYYAARAALQTGFIYEQRGDKVRAVEYFQRCLSLKDHEYKNSLDQRAKAGMMRCMGE